tara:strand:+ start:54 stop:539 length:486 start_codon:yes stop_codon:yes gene_type:complete
MKKILLVALVFFGLQTQAQVGTDLQFSQIISLSGEFSTNVIATKTYHMIGQVPAGKVWKLNYGNSNNQIFLNCSVIPLSASNNFIPKISGIKHGIYVKKDFLTSGVSYVEIEVDNNDTDVKVYFNENDELYILLDASDNNPSASGGCSRYVFQAIEYTVIP